jgi:hypothetical protein
LKVKIVASLANRHIPLWGYGPLWLKQDHIGYFPSGGIGVADRDSDDRIGVGNDVHGQVGNVVSIGALGSIKEAANIALDPIQQNSWSDLELGLEERKKGGQKGDASSKMPLSSGFN